MSKFLVISLLVDRITGISLRSSYELKRVIVKKVLARTIIL